MDEYLLTSYILFDIDNVILKFEKSQYKNNVYDILKNNINIKGFYIIDHTIEILPDFVYNYDIFELIIDMKYLKDFSFFDRLKNLRELSIKCDNVNLILGFCHPNIKYMKVYDLKNDNDNIIFLENNFPKLNSVSFYNCDLKNIVIECDYIELNNCKNINITCDTITCILINCENIINVPVNASITVH